MLNLKLFNIKRILMSLILFIIIIYSIHIIDNINNNRLNISGLGTKSKDEVIHIACVLCGFDKIREIKPLLASAILLSESKLVFHLFSDYNIKYELDQLYKKFPESLIRRIEFKYYETWFPSDDYSWWKNLRSRCMTQRVFFPSLIESNVNSLLYLDLDTIFVTQVEKVWNDVKKLSETEIMAASHDCPFPTCAYYNKTFGGTTHVPVMWDSGLNSGVLFMRLDRMRQFNFEEKIIRLAQTRIYREKLEFAEQDLINILFHNNTEYVKQLDCSYNYFPLFYCNETRLCDKTDGLKIVHGAGRQFKKTGTLFYQILELLTKVDLNLDKAFVLKNLNREINKLEAANDTCKDIRKYIFK